MLGPHGATIMDIAQTPWGPRLYLSTPKSVASSPYPDGLRHGFSLFAIGKEAADGRPVYHHSHDADEMSRTGSRLFSKTFHPMVGSWQIAHKQWAHSVICYRRENRYTAVQVEKTADSADQINCRRKLHVNTSMQSI